MTQSETEFEWGDLGRDWWIAAGESVGATGKQTMFACARYQNASRTAAARLAGYGGDDMSLRGIASRTAKSDVVKALLVRANIEARGEGEGLVDDAEIEREISKLIRSPDANSKIKGIELQAKRQDRKVELGRVPDNDGYFMDRVIRDYLQMQGGGPALVHLWHGAGSPLSNLGLLIDVAAAVLREEPALWHRLRSSYTVETRAWLDRKLADPDYQREAREKLWREIGVDVAAKDAEAAFLFEGSGQASPAAEAPALPATEVNQQAVVEGANGRAPPGLEAAGARSA